MGQSRRFHYAPVTSALPLLNGHCQTAPTGPFRAINGRKPGIERGWRGSSFIVQNGVRRDLRAMVQEHPGRIGRRLSAIMSADVAGYSRLMGLDETGTARILREHRAVSDAVVAKHGGAIVTDTGGRLVYQ